MNYTYVEPHILGLLFSSMTILLALLFLGIAVREYYRQRFDFSTGLACNACMGVLVYAVSTLVSGIYVLIWDPHGNFMLPDRLCSFGGYFSYSSSAALYYSYVLQALQRYWQVKRIKIFDNTWRSLLLVVGQWILSMTVVLPILLTGQLNEIASPFACLVSIDNILAPIYLSCSIYGASIMTLSFVYCRFASHLHRSTLRSGAQMGAHRDLTVIRRILILITVLNLGGLPFFIFKIMNWISPASVPNYYLHIVYVACTFALLVEIVLLLWFTPTTKHCLQKYIRRHRMPQNRVAPMQERRF